MALISKTVGLTAVYQDLVVAAVGTEGSAHGVVFQNNTAASVDVTMTVYKLETGLTTTFGPFPIPAKGNFPWPKPINLQAGDKIAALASTAAAVMVVVSYYSTSDIDMAISAGFTPRGVYAAGATYAVNDVVYMNTGAPENMGSYVSRVAGNIGQTPGLSPTSWQLLSLSGTSVNYVSRGAWSVATSYVIGDTVTNYGSTFLAVNGSTGSEPNIDSTNVNWLCLYQATSEPLEVVAYSATPQLNAGRSTNFQLVATGNPTVSIINPPPAGKYRVITLVFTHSAAPRSITWAANIKWTDNSPPSTATTAGAIDVFTFWTIDGGVNWYGSLAWWSVS